MQEDHEGRHHPVGNSGERKFEDDGEAPRDEHRAPDEDDVEDAGEAPRSREEKSEEQEEAPVGGAIAGAGPTVHGESGGAAAPFRLTPPPVSTAASPAPPPSRVPPQSRATPPPAATRPSPSAPLDRSAHEPPTAVLYRHREQSAPTAIHLDHGPEGILYLTFDTPGKKVNVFDFATLDQLEQLLDEVARAADATALIVRSFKPDCFIAGVDLDVLASASDKAVAMEAARFGQRVFSKVETLRVPIIAAIDGVCLGGGTEFALACHFRLVSDGPATRLGLPEVRLGILPAWGGTQRLPKVIGIARALDMILGGRSLDGKRARRAGLADELIPHDLFADEVLRFTRSVIEEDRGPRRAVPKLKRHERWLESTRLGRKVIFDKAAESIFKTTHGHYPAPPKALEAVRIGVERGNRAGYLLEATFLGELATGSVCKNLVELFFATEAIKKSRGVADRSIAPRKVRKIGILGAGAMGGGIAQLASSNDVAVRLKDINDAALGSALAHADALYAKRVKRRRMSKREMRHKMALISASLDYSGFRQADVVIEAVVENLEIKRRVYRELEHQIGDDCIVVSNTSSLLIADMASAFRRPERFGGMHFFNPVDRMPLVEVIRGPRTSDVAVATVYELARGLGKTPIVVKDSPGFLVNRILMPYLNEACILVEEGASIEQIDQVLFNFGMPMGPLRLLDEVGLDVARHAAGVMTAAFADHVRPSRLLEALGKDTGGNDEGAAPKRLGKKSGFGFYRHQGVKEPVPDPQIYEIVHRVQEPRAGEVAPEPGTVVMSNILDRLLLLMINEAARCLEESVVETPREVDLGMVMGTGFPPFRGGLLRYADELGVEDVVKRMRMLADEGRTTYEPTGSLLDMVRRGERFYPVAS